MRLSIKRVNERLEQFLRIEQLRVTTSVRATYVSETKLKGEKSLRWISARSTRRAGLEHFKDWNKKDTGAVCPIDETQKILDRVKPAKHWHELREVDGCRSEHVELLVAGNGLRLNNRPRVVVQDGAGAQK